MTFPSVHYVSSEVNMPSDSQHSRAIAQVASRWLPTAAVRGSRPGHMGFCGG
jgi:hypothetical protein